MTHCLIDIIGLSITGTLVITCGGESPLFVSCGILTTSSSIGSDAVTVLNFVSSALAMGLNINKNDKAKAMTREILRFMIYLLSRLKFFPDIRSCLGLMHSHKFDCVHNALLDLLNRS
jgi:hypothetical protein